ncbi:hypothetical protein EDF24_0200 [Curtobacterium sp. PhB130]|uniref:hypothetical protein n=1 Tax=unclassified Curtobacterium TaxID=257496 RepID=UPI000F4B579D|nr:MULTISPECIES: hypothetical protein [unclassified Curtobacterium]ROS77444.1 hypothetical protein EDF24_0200 [Curtobacterium sp. PhB130]TCK66349.1 hypothetical protein EDF27_1102 [Curtobacterium sp. PhB136]
MLIRLRFVLAEAFGSPTSLRIWGAHAAQVVVTGAVIAVMCSLVETASRLGGQTGGALRSFTTPGTVAAAICAMIVTGSASRATHDALRSLRTPWAASGVAPSLATGAIAAQVAVVNAVSMLAGLLIARAAVATASNTPIPDAEVPLRFGSATVVGALVIVGAALAPSTVNAVRTPYRARTPERGTTSAVLLAIGGALWTGLATWVAILPVMTTADVERGAGLSLLTLVGAIVLASATLTRTRRSVATAVVRFVPDRAPTWLLLGTRSAADTLRRSTAPVAPVLVSVSLAGGTVAVFAVGDAASDHVTGAALGSTVNIAAIMLTLAPVLVISTAASVIAFVSTRPSRASDGRLLRAVGTPLATIIGAAVAEATITVVVAASTSAVVVSAACIPLTMAADVSAGELLDAVANPVQVLVLGGVAALLVTSSVVTGLLNSRRRRTSRAIVETTAPPRS